MRAVVNAVGPSWGPRSARSRSPGPGGGIGSAPGLAMPWISRSPSVTFSTFPSRTRARNWLIGMSTVWGARSQLCTDRTTISAMNR